MEREGKGRKGREVCNQSCIVDVKEKSTETNIRSHSLQTLRKFYSDGWDLREHLQRRARQAVIGENSIQRKIKSEWSTRWRSRIWSEGNSEYALTESQRELESRRQQLSEANQIKHSTRGEYICVADWGMKDHLHQECYARSCREIEEFKKRHCSLQEGKYCQKNNEDCKNFLCSVIRNHEQWVYWGDQRRRLYEWWESVEDSKSFTILTYWAVMTTHVPHQVLITSSSRKAQPRSWNAAKYTREYECSWKHFWLSTCSTRSWWITQWFKKFGDIIWWFWEDKELRIVGAKNHCNQYFHLAFQ